jgi:hypothetical protein
MTPPSDRARWWLLTAVGLLLAVFGVLTAIASLLPAGLVAIHGGRVEEAKVVVLKGDYATVRMHDDSVRHCAGGSSEDSRVRVVINESKCEVLDWAGASGGAVALAFGLGAVALARLQL